MARRSLTRSVATPEQVANFHKTIADLGVGVDELMPPSTDRATLATPVERGFAAEVSRRADAAGTTSAVLVRAVVISWLKNR